MRLNFQRCNSEVDGALDSMAGGLEPKARGAAPDGGGPELARPAGGRGAFAGGRPVGQSRASFTTPRICSNHQLARLERPRPRPALLSPGWFSKPSSN